MYLAFLKKKKKQTTDITIENNVAWKQELAQLIVELGFAPCGMGLWGLGDWQE